MQIIASFDLLVAVGTVLTMEKGMICLQ